MNEKKPVRPLWFIVKSDASGENQCWRPISEDDALAVRPNMAYDPPLPLHREAMLAASPDKEKIAKLSEALKVSQSAMLLILKHGYHHEGNMAIGDALKAIDAALAEVGRQEREFSSGGTQEPQASGAGESADASKACRTLAATSLKDGEAKICKWHGTFTGVVCPACSDVAQGMGASEPKKES